MNKAKSRSNRNRVSDTNNVFYKVKPHFTTRELLDIEQRLGKLQISAKQISTTSHHGRETAGKGQQHPSELNTQQDKDRKFAKTANILSSQKQNKAALASPKNWSVNKGSNLPSTTFQRKDSTNSSCKRTGKLLQWNPKLTKMGDKSNIYCFCSETNTSPVKKNNYVCENCNTAHLFDCYESLYRGYSDYINNVTSEIYCNYCDLQLNPDRQSWVKFLDRIHRERKPRLEQFWRFVYPTVLGLTRLIV